jgi:intein-encoded DNA endonuclease-like protein
MVIKIDITKEYLIEEYTNKNRGSNKIAHDFNVNPKIILKRLKNFGIPIKKTTDYKKFARNDNFFENWSHEMAYCLGFITADGHIHKNRSVLAIGIHSKDLEVLTYIKNCISPETPVYFSRNRKLVSFSITSRKILYDLKKYNVDNKKTFNLKIDFDIPGEYWGDYLRGFFDGDGSVNLIIKGKYLCLQSSFCSMSEIFIKELREKCDNIGRLCKQKQKSDKYIYRWILAGKDTLKLREIIYSDFNSFGMKRKKDKLFYQNAPLTILSQGVINV